MNVELLRKVQKHILENPARLMMGDWVKKGIPGGPIFQLQYPERTFAECGTAGCIAGWSLMLGQGKTARDLTLESDLDVFYYAQQVLELDYEQCTELFYVRNWPFEFKYYSDDGSEASAKMAAARIDAFIEKYSQPTPQSV